MLKIEEKLLTNKLVRPGIKLLGKKIIVVHWTANTGKGSNASANNRYFNNITDRKLIASAHYNVDDSHILRNIPDDEMAYHAGAKVYTKFMTGLLKKYNVLNPNRISIGIEMCVNSDGNFEKTRANTIDLVKHLMKEYNIPVENVIRHYDVTGKICPKPFVDNHSAWEEFKKALVTTPAVEVDTIAPEKVVEPSVSVYIVKAGDTLSKIAEDVYKDSKLYTKLMKMNGLTTTVITIGQKIKY